MAGSCSTLEVWYDSIDSTDGSDGDDGIADHVCSGHWLGSAYRGAGDHLMAARVLVLMQRAIERAERVADGSPCERFARCVAAAWNPAWVELHHAASKTAYRAAIEAAEEHRSAAECIVAMRSAWDDELASWTVRAEDSVRTAYKRCMGALSPIPMHAEGKNDAMQALRDIEYQSGYIQIEMVELAIDFVRAHWGEHDDVEEQLSDMLSEAGARLVREEVEALCD